MILKPMDAVQLDAMLLRARAPDLLLRPGMTLAARVAERAGRHGILVLAGAALTAELPEGVAAGDRLRLTVQEASAERVVLKIADPPAPPAPGLLPIPLPGGAAARVRVEDRGGRRRGEEGEGDRVAVTYESPALGPVELDLRLEAGALVAAVRVGAGAPFELAEEAAEALRAALAEAAGRPAQVSLVPRRDPLDLYA